MPLLVVRFGPFELDVRLRELRKGSTVVRLQDQPFAILALMLERPGDVVTRAEIARHLWPDGTSVDFEHSVNAAIRRLRTALGDDADAPRFVETLPRRGYRFIAPLATDPSAAEPRRASDRRPRLVVLPFVNLTGETGRDVFIDGFTEEMIAQLGRVCADRIGVLARTSAMLYKNVNRRAAEIGDALRADYLVEGSVRIAGDRVRITAQLIDTRDETHLWADSYDRQLSDCLLVQTEVAAEIAHTLTRELLPSPSSSCGTGNTLAYEAYMTGRFHWNRSGDSGLFDALTCYDKAIALDPAFGRAHVARARAYLSMADYYRREPADALRIARAAAERALDLDSSEAEAYVVLGEARRVLDWDWDGARTAYRRALSLNPNSEVANRYYAWFLKTRGPDAEALAAADRAFDLDPLCLSMITATAGLRYFVRDFEKAFARAQHALGMEPLYEPARRVASAALVQLGRPDDAVELLDELPERSLSPVSLAWKGHALAAAGCEARARGLLRKLVRLPPDAVVSDYHLALLHAGLGEWDDVCVRLARACDRRDPWLEAMVVDPRFEALRADRRFRALRDRLGLDAAVGG